MKDSPETKSKMKRGSRDWWLAFALIKLADRAQKKAPGVSPVTLSIADVNTYLEEIFEHPLKMMWYLATARLSMETFVAEVNVIDEHGEVTPLVKNVGGNYEAAD